jgi:hypothetical protein
MTAVGSVVHLLILRQMGFQQGASPLVVAGFQQAHHAPTEVRCHDGPIGHGIVEAPELEKDPFDTREVVEAYQRLSHHPDLVVLARPELAPAEDQPVVGIVVMFRDGSPGHGTRFYRTCGQVTGLPP